MDVKHLISLMVSVNVKHLISLMASVGVKHLINLMVSVNVKHLISLIVFKHQFTYLLTYSMDVKHQVYLLFTV